MLELFCPVCGALIEAETMESLIVLAREHTVDAHHYSIPDAHVIEAVQSGASEH